MIAERKQALEAGCLALPERAAEMGGASLPVPPAFASGALPSSDASPSSSQPSAVAAVGSRVVRVFPGRKGRQRRAVVQKSVRAAPKQARWTWARRLWWWSPRLGWGLAGLFVLPPLWPMLMALAGMANDLGRASSQLATAGADVSTAVAGIAVAVARSGRELSHEAWRGVDIVEMKLNVDGWKWCQHYAVPRLQVMEGPMKELLERWPAEWRVHLAETLRHAHAGVPLLERAWVNASVAGTYESVTFYVAWLSSQWLAVHVVFASATFRLQWANPVWELLAWPADDEYEQLVDRLRVAVNSTLRARGFDGSAMFGNLPDDRIFRATWW